MKFKVLVVDDEKNIRDGLASALEMDGYELFTAADGEEARDFINNNDVDLVITDLRMPKMSGYDLLKHLTSSFPTLPVIILTGHGTIETAVGAMRDGAFDFLTKPVNLDRLSLLVKRALSNRELVLSHRKLEEEVKKIGEAHKYSQMIGKSAQMRKIFETIQQVASSRASVLITGESGVGKELVADALHNLSNRNEKPFVKVHCAALSETLLESELFGHEKGSFTGAIGDKKGRFELADKGTLFLDEIGEINQAVQVKILRVLQAREFERVGGVETISVDVRVIAATNKDLKEEIEKGNFREDLFYRLNVVNIHVPPLRERREDISLLVTSFITEISEENDKNIEGIEPKAMAALYNYSWPGNIRELRNSIESAVVMCRGDVIALEDLPPSIAQSTEGDFIRIKPGSTISEAERIMILETLKREKGNKSKTAEILNISRKTLYERLKDFEIE